MYFFICMCICVFFSFCFVFFNIMNTEVFEEIDGLLLFIELFVCLQLVNEIRCFRTFNEINY